MLWTDLFGFLQRDGASAQPVKPLFIYLVIGADDLSACYGDFKVIIPVSYNKYIKKPCSVQEKGPLHTFSPENQDTLR